MVMQAAREAALKAQQVAMAGAAAAGEALQQQTARESRINVSGGLVRTVCLSTRMPRRIIPYC